MVKNEPQRLSHSSGIFNVDVAKLCCLP